MWCFVQSDIESGLSLICYLLFIQGLHRGCVSSLSFDESSQRLMLHGIFCLVNMVGVLRVDSINPTATLGGMRHCFKEGGSRPEDIHFVIDANGKPTGSAFLVFLEFEDAKQGLSLNGKPFMGRNLLVRRSNPPEFNKVFPGLPMLTRPKGFFRNNREVRPYGGRANAENTADAPPIRIPARSGRVFDENRRGDRARSRSPVARRDFDRREPDRRRFERERPNNNRSSISNMKNKFLQLSGVAFNVTEFDVQNFFRPVLTRDIFFMRSNGGRFGDVIIGFFSESDAKEAMKMNGRRLGSRSVSITRPRREDIMHVLHMDDPPPETSYPSDSNLPDLSGLSAVANTNPQVQQLLHLLTATVNSLAGAAAASSQQHYEGRETYREQRQDRRRESRGVNPVISRVANSAKIDVDDINMGRVVGIRNLPYSVTPDEVLDFFHGFHAIPDSVRIHYLEDGRCSGDAIISFQAKKDARKAVSTLNKRMVGRRRVELFFL